MVFTNVSRLFVTIRGRGIVPFGNCVVNVFGSKMAIKSIGTHLYFPMKRFFYRHIYITVYLYSIQFL